MTSTDMRNVMAMATVMIFASMAGGCGSSDMDDDDSTDAEGDVSVTALTGGGDYMKPLDSVPDGQATVVYFIANGTHGPGVFSVPGDGGVATELLSGAPFVDPHGIEISSDDKTLYIADRQSGTDGGGGVFAMKIADRDPILVPGSAGTGAGALDVVSVGGHDQIYFTGTSSTGQASAFLLPAAGGELSVLFQGAPLVEPDGIAVTRGGEAFISDRAAGGSGMGRLFKVTGGAISTALDMFKAGEPSGIALTSDENTLLISSLNASDGSDQVVLLNVPDGSSSIFTDVVGQNHNDAGGVHRASQVDIFSWCGTTAGTSGQGTIYRVSLY